MTGQPLVVDGTPVRRPPAKAAGGSSLNGGRPTPTCVARRRLVERLEEGVDNRVTVLTAPAGYGKSVLVDHWVASHRRARVACVTFQPGDDGARAAARLTAALAGLGGDPFSVTPASHGRDRAQLGDRFIGRLVDGLAAVGQAVLVLDAVDAPSSGSLAPRLATLADQLPANVHLVVTGRSRRPVGPSVVGGDQVVVVGARDLAFTPDEAWLLVRDLSGRELTDDQLGMLLQRTEGWVVGIGLAAVGLRTAGDPGRLIAGFSGRDGNVAAFLRGQVLAREAPVVRRFLTRTSVLRTLNGPLCDAITGEADGGAQLRSLEDRGMFLNRLPGSGGRFAYHHLMRDFLRHELRITEPQAQDALLRRAATWHASRAQPEVAVPYLIDAQAWRSVVALVDRCGPAMLRAGRAADVARWLDAVPASHETTDVELALRSACLSTAVGAFARAADIVHHVERRTCSPRQQLTVDLLRAMWGCFDTTGESALRAVEAVRARLEAAPATDQPDTVGVASALALAESAAVLRARAAWFDGDIAAGRRALALLARGHQRFAAERVRALSTLALLEAWAGDLSTAGSHATQVIAIARRAGLLLHPAVVDGRLAAAHVLRQRGDLAGAADALAETYGVAVGTGPPTMYAPYAVEQARWYLASGQPQHGLCVLARCRPEPATAWPAALASRRRAVEIELLIASGRSDRAEALLAATPPAAAGAAVSAAAVHAAVARGDLDAARARLRTWGGVDGEAIERLQHGLWLSIVDFEAGSRRQALEGALDVVQQAEPQGHIQVFLEAGRPGERLFRALYHTSPTPYIRRILRAAQTSSQPSGPTVLGLSRRELEVVRYLPTPLSSSEIAARLYISLNTLKTHLQAIYGKLGVTGRRDAIRQAQRLGLA